MSEDRGGTDYLGVYTVLEPWPSTLGLFYTCNGL